MEHDFSQALAERMKGHRISSHCNSKDQERRLKIGYVSMHLDNPGTCVALFAGAFTCM
jgi:hypothetical protein